MAWQIGYKEKMAISKTITSPKYMLAIYLPCSHLFSYLSIYWTYFFQKGLPRWDRILTQSRFIRNWVIFGIHWMVHWWSCWWSKVVIVARLLRKEVDGRIGSRGWFCPTTQSDQGGGLNQSPPMEWAIILSIPPTEMLSPGGSFGSKF